MCWLNVLLCITLCRTIGRTSVRTLYFIETAILLNKTTAKCWIMITEEQMSNTSKLISKFKLVLQLAFYGAQRRRATGEAKLSTSATSGGKRGTIPIFPHSSIIFSNFSLIFRHFLPQFGSPDGQLPGATCSPGKALAVPYHSEFYSVKPKWYLSSSKIPKTTFFLRSLIFLLLGPLCVIHNSEWLTLRTKP